MVIKSLVENWDSLETFVFFHLGDSFMQTVELLNIPWSDCSLTYFSLFHEHE